MKLHVSPLRNIGRAMSGDFTCNVRGVLHVLAPRWHSQFAVGVFAKVNDRRFTCGYRAPLPNEGLRLPPITSSMPLFHQLAGDISRFRKSFHGCHFVLL